MGRAGGQSDRVLLDDGGRLRLVHWERHHLISLQGFVFVIRE